MRRPFFVPSFHQVRAALALRKSSAPLKGVHHAVPGSAQPPSAPVAGGQTLPPNPRNLIGKWINQYSSGAIAPLRRTCDNRVMRLNRIDERTAWETARAASERVSTLRCRFHQHIISMYANGIPSSDQEGCESENGRGAVEEVEARERRI